MKINKYPDGSSYVIIPSGMPSNEVLTFKINNYEDLWHLNQLIDVYNNMGVTLTIIIPNLIDAQADRRFANNQSSGLKLVCKFLNSMKANFKIFHPHNPEVVEALMDNVEIIDNSSFITTVLHRIDNVEGNNLTYNQLKGGGMITTTTVNNTILMSSDAGGFKPLMKLCDKINWQGETYSASKSRSWSTTQGQNQLTQLVNRNDFNGKDILIIDDISVYGSTFKGLSTLLRERNCGKLYLAVSHMTVQNLGKDPVTNYFDRVFTTNSKFDEYYHLDGQGYDQIMGVKPSNLEIIKLF